MDVSTVAGLASSLKTAGDMAKAMLGMKIDAEVRDAISALQNSLITAQSAALESLVERDELYRRLRDLEKKVEEAEDWRTFKKQFKPVDYSNGKITYTSENPDYPGLYCPKCFENNRASRLQEIRASNGFRAVECLQCDTRLTLASGTIAQNSSRVSDFGRGGY